MSTNLIEFHTTPALLNDFPPPYPAVRGMPDWIKQMPPEGAPNVPTLKRCPPLIEAMGCGYIIPMPADVTLTVHADRVDMSVAGYTDPLVGLHHQVQFPGAPFDHMPALKFHCPWLIKTPPGYSTLFLPPLNHFNQPFIPFSGLVETDTYYRALAFPAVCLLGPGQQVVLKRGMPLVQAIPIKREDWTSSHAAWDREKLDAQQQELDANLHMYRERYLVKKTYG